MRYKFVAVEGNIGAGKTTLAKVLSERLNGKLILEEFAENPLLPLFYEDSAKYAFPLEMSFMAERYDQLSKALGSYELFYTSIISDYLVDKSLLFSKINLKEAEYQLYWKFFNFLFKEVRRPDVVLYLHSSVDQLKSNIIKRGRSYEKSINSDYLKSLETMYFNFMKNDLKVKYVVINRQDIDYDFVNNNEDVLKILDLLKLEFKYGLNFLN